MIHKWKIPLLLAAGVIALSTSPVFIRLSSAPAAVIAFYRLGIAVLIMTPFMRGNEIAPMRKMTVPDLLQTAAAGTCLALHFVLWFEALNYTSMASAVFFATLSPLFSYVAGYLLFQDAMTWKLSVAGLIALIGGFVIGFGDMQLSGLAFRGDVLAFMSAAAASGYWLIGQRLRKNMSFYTYTYVLYGAGAIVLLAYVLITGVSLLVYDSSEWLLFFSLALIPTLLGHGLFNWLLRWVSATVVSVSILAEAVVVSVFGYVLFGENISLSQWTGGMLILIGIFRFLNMWMRGSRKSR